MLRAVTLSTFKQKCANALVAQPFCGPRMKSFEDYITPIVFITGGVFVVAVFAYRRSEQGKEVAPLLFGALLANVLIWFFLLTYSCQTFHTACMLGIDGKSAFLGQVASAGAVLSILALLIVPLLAIILVGLAIGKVSWMVRGSKVL